MRKRVIAVIVSLLILFMIPMQLVASEINKDSPIGPMWTSIVDFANTFSISSSGEAIVNSQLHANSNINRVVLTTSIQQYKNGSWTTIKSWSSTSYSSSGLIDQNWNLVSGYNYRLVSSGSVYENGTLIETTSYISASRWY
jgi:hypothetical protein